MYYNTVAFIEGPKGNTKTGKHLSPKKPSDRKCSGQESFRLESLVESKERDQDMGVMIPCEDQRRSQAGSQACWLRAKVFGCYLVGFQQALNSTLVFSGALTSAAPPRTCLAWCGTYSP